MAPELPPDLEQGNASIPAETSPLLTPPPLGPSRPSYRKRAMSKSYVVETYQTRWWTGVLGGVLGVAILVAAGTFVVLHTRGKSGGSSGKGKSETPDYSKLPAEQPGLRNPNYLVSGRNGAVASEVDLCSAIGVDGERMLTDRRMPELNLPGDVVLKDGGTATDAAIATALCIGVTNMFSSGIGGGG
jgi:gamma-glutamyltranspeptidase/glutathione hydrolase/leukotriene-C4 hydrolase